MNRMSRFTDAMRDRHALKVIAGISNHNIENVKNVISAAHQGGAHAVDICFDREIFDMAREMTDLPIFVSSIVPSELATAAEWGADAIELGNFDALYREGHRVSAEDVWNWAKETHSLLNGREIFFSVTIPGHISVSEQIDLAHKLESLHINLIQTEGAATVDTQKTGALGLLETSSVSIANTMELSANTEIPVMTASGISVKTAPLAFASGASAIGAGSAVNRCESLISMIATVRSIVEATSRHHHTDSSKEMLHM